MLVTGDEASSVPRSYLWSSHHIRSLLCFHLNSTYGRRSFIDRLLSIHCKVDIQLTRVVGSSMQFSKVKVCMSWNLLAAEDWVEVCRRLGMLLCSTTKHVYQWILAVAWITQAFYDRYGADSNTRLVCFVRIRPPLRHLVITLN